MEPPVFLVDNDRALGASLAALHEAAALAFSVYRSAEEFLAVAESLTEGCVVMDVRLPGMSGPELQRALVARGFRLPIIFLTAHGDVATSVRVLRAGAFDFLEKPVDGDILLERVRAALDLDAKRREADEEKRRLHAKLSRLTAREREVMDMVVRGSSNKAVAKRLCISHRTVEVYRSRVMQKLQLSTLLQLVVFAEACGAVDTRESVRLAAASIHDNGNDSAAMPVRVALEASGR